ncbi:UNVERIFIED_CONTAM: hypothetical protein Scaly_0175500 [Sesamum calycinum]|uniref:Uncharacterized protein n=1 Tax=Sesamum calycinum TaxID=2727403 RepID=A0AAW2T0F1_9LAMI
MNGAKRSAEAVGRKNTSVGERSALEGSPRVSSGGRSGSENVGLSNANIGENPMPRKPKGSSKSASRTESSSQSSSDKFLEKGKIYFQHFQQEAATMGLDFHPSTRQPFSSTMV